MNAKEKVLAKLKDSGVMFEYTESSTGDLIRIGSECMIRFTKSGHINNAEFPAQEGDVANRVKFTDPLKVLRVLSELDEMIKTYQNPVQAARMCYGPNAVKNFDELFRTTEGHAHTYWGRKLAELGMSA